MKKRNDFSKWLLIGIIIAIVVLGIILFATKMTGNVVSNSTVCSPNKNYCVSATKYSPCNGYGTGYLYPNGIACTTASGGTACNTHADGYGYCEKQTTCTDSDGGINYDVKGYASTDGGTTKNWDTCLSNTNSSTVLREYSCSGNIMKYNQTVCENGCSDGACAPLKSTCGNENREKNSVECTFYEGYPIGDSDTSLSIGYIDTSSVIITLKEGGITENTPRLGEQTSYTFKTLLDRQNLRVEVNDIVFQGYAGGHSYVVLTFYLIPICGNSYCENLENYDNCAKDCPAYYTDINSCKEKQFSPDFTRKNPEELKLTNVLCDYDEVISYIAGVYCSNGLVPTQMGFGWYTGRIPMHQSYVCKDVYGNWGNYGPDVSAFCCKVRPVNSITGTAVKTLTATNIKSYTATISKDGKVKTNVFPF